MTSFITHEIKILNDRPPPWINNKVKISIQEKKTKFIDLFEK